MSKEREILEAMSHAYRTSLHEVNYGLVNLPKENPIYGQHPYIWRKVADACMQEREKRGK